MELNRPVDDLITEVLGMAESDCLDTLRSLPPMYRDFTDAYLASLTLEQLRHIVMAACLQARKAQLRHRLAKADGPST